SGTNGNPGFELEVDLFTQSSGQTGIALYNVDGTSSPVLIWSANDYTQFSQVSIAGTNDNGDPDSYLDFFIPWNKITGISSLGITGATNIRFVPTTVMAPKAAIGGPKSDIYGSNDALYPDPNLQYETLLAAMPGFSINQLTATPVGSIPGTGNTQLCTAAPGITSVTNNGGANSKGVVTGTWSKLAISPQTAATITVNLNGVLLTGTTTATSGSTWTFDIPASVTLAAGNKITAQAQASGENRCLSSNTFVVTSCSPSTWAAAALVTPQGDNSSTNYNCFIGTSATTTKGIGGANRNAATWAVFVNEGFSNTTKNSTADQGTTAFTNGGSSTFTAGTAPYWLYSNGCSGGSNMGAGIYTFWYQDANGCKSDVMPVCVIGTGNSTSQVAGTVNVTPTVSPATINAGTTEVTVTGAAGSTISLYFNGEVIATGNIPGTYNSATPASGTITFTNLAFSQNGVVSATSKIIGSTINTSYCIAKSTAQIVAPCITPTPAIIVKESTGLLKAGSAITGTGPTSATIKLYNAANTLLATTTVSGNGSWTTDGAQFSNGFAGLATAGTTYYATAQTICSVSAPSANATTANGSTTARCGSISTTGVTPSTTAVSGTLSGTAVANTLVNLYEDGFLISSFTTSNNSWGPIDVTDKLHPGVGSATGLLTVGVQEPGKEELLCTATTAVTCSGPMTPSYTQQSSNGTTGADATVPRGGTITYTVTNLSPNTFYSVADAATGKPYTSGIWTGSSVTSGSSLSITTYPLTISGAYNGVLKATNVAATSMCSSPGAASIFRVLPVTIVEFKGVRNNKMNLLTWKTALEGNTVSFEIEKSSDGVTFQPIGSVAAKGGSSSYTFTDGQVAAVNYYRLRIVAADLTVTYTRTVLLKENGSSVLLNVVRPNPFENEITVSLSSATRQTVTLILLDAAGRSVARKQVVVQGANDVKLNGLGRLPKGLYVLKVAADGTTFQEKLIKRD
ncbi:MAG: T9SS type A sorting domain-containing protein, partial [Bacteroidota bacterium]|nr:T9SS type A sorting domain-containing protein [Bacteroidota bacterium]